MLQTTEKASSVKGFALDKSFVKSLIYIKNRSDPKIDPWVTPALASAHQENWTFKTTLCFLSFRKSVIKLRSLLEISLF